MYRNAFPVIVIIHENMFWLTVYRSCWYSSDIIQLLPALKVNIIIVHPRGVVFPRADNKGNMKKAMY
jgi:hypothetical protein